MRSHGRRPGESGEEPFAVCRKGRPGIPGQSSRWGPGEHPAQPPGCGLRMGHQDHLPAGVKVVEPGRLRLAGSQCPQFLEREDPGQPVVAARGTLEIHLGNARNGRQRRRQTVREDSVAVLGKHGAVLVELYVPHAAAR